MVLTLNQFARRILKLRFLNSSSNSGSCPSLYETENGDIVVQGYQLTELSPEALLQLRDVLPGEGFVVVPRSLLDSLRSEPEEVKEAASEGLIGDPAALNRLFLNFSYTAYRLEVRAAYGVAEEDVPYQKYLAGEDPGTQWLKPWLDLMAEQAQQGKRVRRVRVVDDPPSDYLRWEIV